MHEIHIFVNIRYNERGIKNSYVMHGEKTSMLKCYSMEIQRMKKL